MVIVVQRRDGALTAVEPNAAQRLRARLTAANCDRRLARGEPPEGDVCLAIRADHLVRSRTRQWMARSLQRLLDDAVTGRPPATPWAPGGRRRLTHAATELTETIDDLRRPVPVSSQGLAALCDLLRDGAGPLHGPGTSDDLRRRLGQVRAQLRPGSIWPA